MRSGSPPAKRLRLKTTPEDDVPAADRIFISYRREETAYAAGWLFDRLAERFGPDQIFKDVDSIELGEDFVREINRAVGSTDVLLALIGDRWLTVTDDDGVRRLDHSEDFVRIEIEAALSRDVRVIPILIDGATMPREAELPPSLAPLARRQALELDPARFQSDTSRLLAAIETALAEQRRPTQHASIGPRDPLKKKRPQVAAPAESATSGARGDEISASPGGWRESVRAHPRLLTGLAAASILVAAAIAVLVAHSNSGANTQPTGGDSASTQAASFVDDFSSERYGWELASSGGAEGRYQNGTYRLTATREDSAEGYSAAMASPDAQPTSADVRIQVDARLVGGTATHARGYGIFCRAGGSQDVYVFSVWKEGAEIGKFANGEYQRLSTPDPNAVSLPDEASKHLEAVCRTKTASGSPVVALEFWANSARVATATDPEEVDGGATPLISGHYGLQVIFGPNASPDTTVDVEFDNFEVSSS